MPTIHKGDRIAQLVIPPQLPELYNAYTPALGERGQRGFGSTGT